MDPDRANGECFPSSGAGSIAVEAIVAAVDPTVEGLKSPFLLVRSRHFGFGRHLVALRDQERPFGKGISAFEP